MFEEYSYRYIVQTVLKQWGKILVLTILYLLYKHYTSTFNYFKKKNIIFLKPKILIGSLGPRVFLQKSFHEFQLDLYNYFKGQPYGGTFEGRNPVLLVRDPELIKLVAVRDFDHFTDRNTLKSREPLYVKRQLLNLCGDEWKGVRGLLSPTFSPSRIRSMMPIIQQCSEQLINLMQKHNGQDVEMKDFLGHFTLEVIGACAFGIKCDVLAKGNSTFVKVADKFNYMSIWKRIIFFTIILLIPEASKFLTFSFFNPDSVEKLLKILTTNKKERRSGEYKRPDFLQLMIDASDNERRDTNNKNEKIHLDDATIDAQSLLFLLAGYETSSTLLSFAVHVLATKPDIQDKLRAHIEDVTNGNDITYEMLAELTYLERFLLETLRLYPPVSRLDRLCTKDYNLPGTDINLQVGDIVSIPIYGVHMDPSVYPEPHEFRPERFDDVETKNRPSHLFLGFGTGPRHCIEMIERGRPRRMFEDQMGDFLKKLGSIVPITAVCMKRYGCRGSKIGQRFAFISAKLAVIALMRNFKFTTCEKTTDPVIFDKRSFLLKSASGLWVNVKKL